MEIAEGSASLGDKLGLFLLGSNARKLLFFS